MGDKTKVGVRRRVGWLVVVVSAIALLLPSTLATASSSKAAGSATAATGTARASAGTQRMGTSVVAQTYNKAPKPSARQMAALQQANANSPRPGPETATYKGPMPAAMGQGTAAPSGRQAATAALPTDFKIYRNSALDAGGLRSAVDEPSTDANGKWIFQTGNWYAARSNANGAATSWTFVDPFTLFGSGFCCDQVTVYDQSHDRQFWLLQFSGRLVLANSDGQNLLSWCYYNWTPAMFGLPTTASFDYNHMAVSTNYVYVTTNVYGASGGSLVFRAPIDAMTNCAGFGFGYIYRTTEFSNAFVQNASDTMYWGTNWTNMTLGSTFRILRWADNSGSYSWYDRAIDPFSFMFFGGGQNCASQDGAVLNWCQRTDSRMSGGGYLAAPSIASGGGEGDSIVGFAFNANQDGSHPFPYIRRVYFRSSDLAYFGASEFFGTWAAHLYPDMAPDERGHIGMVFAWGGGTGTAHYFPGGGVVIDDDISPTQPWAYSFITPGAGNACLNSDGLRRWGDYLTVRPLTPARYGWVGTVFALNSNAGGCGSTASVNVRNIAFGRFRDVGAYNRWKTK